MNEDQNKQGGRRKFIKQNIGAKQIKLKNTTETSLNQKRQVKQFKKQKNIPLYEIVEI